jgi:hypothetical protein
VRDRWAARVSTPVVFLGFVGVLVVLSNGCLKGDDRGHPLYPSTDPRPSRQDVARLVGAVDFVDGQQVPRSVSTFELLPGCHVVVTPRNWGRSAGNYVGLAVPMGRASYAISMRAGHEYRVDVEVRDPAEPQGSVQFFAVERAPDGSTVRRIAPATTEEEVQDCLIGGAGVATGERPISGAPSR